MRMYIMMHAMHNTPLLCCFAADLSLSLSAITWASRPAAMCMMIVISALLCHAFSTAGLTH
jgi:hypothetical protein